MDGEFESIRGDLATLKINLNTTSNNEHVPEIERHIRTLKERARCVYNTLPFKSLPERLVIELIHYATFWLNSFPPNDGISKKDSPRTIVTGLRIDYTKHCKLEFGSYVQTHEEHDNSMSTRTTGALALRPTGNNQGGYYFFSLTTGRVLNRNNWTSIPMPGEVVDRVNTMSRRGRNHNQDLIMLGRNGIDEILDQDDDDDESWRPDDDDDSNGSDDSDDEEENESFDDNQGLGSEEPDSNELVNEETDEIGSLPNEETQHDILAPEGEDQYDTIPPEGEYTPALLTTDDADGDMDERYGPRNHTHGLRPRRPRDFSHLHTTLEETVMTQFNMHRGIKEFGDEGINAVLKELQQLHDRGVLKPVLASSLSMDDRQCALAYLMFLKQKRDGKIKGRGCADGRKQRLNINKEDASSPTVSIEAVLLSSTIDAHEERDVATIDITGAFMQAEMD
jgi:hypothetical protein